MGFQISLCKFHKNSLSERLLEGKAVTHWDVSTKHTAISQNASFQFLTEGIFEKKAVTLWDELTEHKAVSQKASFQFWTEDISFFNIALYGLPNIPLPIPQEQP